MKGHFIATTFVLLFMLYLVSAQDMNEIIRTLDHLSEYQTTCVRIRAKYFYVQKFKYYNSIGIPVCPNMIKNNRQITGEFELLPNFESNVDYAGFVLSKKLLAFQFTDFLNEQ